MAGVWITLFVEHLPEWVRAAPGERFPCLETLVARGRSLPAPTPVRSADAVRMALLGGDPGTGVPAGALTATADCGRVVDGYWLRADPVSLSAGMVQVYLTGAGMPDYTAPERAAVRDAVASELARHGLTLHAGHPERWTIPLTAPPDFPFTALCEALGGDLADLLPAGDAARPWRHLMNELQVLLHNHPVNERRRAAGRPTVNGIWFWGGGSAPAAPDPRPFERVFSNHPVSAGMARCAGIEPEPPVGADWRLKRGETAFIDWLPSGESPAEALAELDRQLDAAWAAASAVGARVSLVAGDGRGWLAPRKPRWGAWRRRPLSSVFGPAVEP